MSAAQMQPATSTAPLLQVEGLKKHYSVRTGFRSRAYVHAVDDVSFTIAPGETLGLVGESGSGKSTIGRCVLRLEAPSAGRVVFAGRSLTDLGARELRALRRHAQIVFQDPYDSLNPRMTVGALVMEPLLLHKLCARREAANRAKELFAQVGLKQELFNRYPHQLSGGQNQRVSIARALATGPRLLVLDEPTSALDVSVQAKLLNLLAQLQADLGLSYLFISHDLAVVNYLAARVAVLYLGRIVEIGSRDALFARPEHPYTRALMSALPGEKATRRERIVLTGEIPSALNPPSGCRLASRCPYVVTACREREQPLMPIGNAQLVACERALAGEID